MRQRGKGISSSGNSTEAGATGMEERPGWLGIDGMRQEKGEGLLLHAEFFPLWIVGSP